MSGISDPDIQNEPLSGYGLYGQNVYLKGTFIAEGGKIGNLSIADIENNLNALEIDIVSSAGTIVKTGTPLSTNFTHIFIVVIFYLLMKNMRNIRFYGGIQ